MERGGGSSGGLEPTRGAVTVSADARAEARSEHTPPHCLCAVARSAGRAELQKLKISRAVGFSGMGQLACRLVWSADPGNDPSRKPTTARHTRVMLRGQLARKQQGIGVECYRDAPT